MEKILTIFERDPETRKVTRELVVPPALLTRCLTTEKVDGTNIRVTVRAGGFVRVEARRNPTKRQKEQGIIEPWYRELDFDFDADRVTGEHGSDRWIADAVRNTDLSEVPDGEWSGEAIGPKIQGNPLGLEQHTVLLFSLREVRERIAFEDDEDIPIFMPVGGDVRPLDEIKEWLETAESKVAPGHPIEGVVFWLGDGSGNYSPIGKLKRKDFA